jgi:hypothetical protein
MANVIEDKMALGDLAEDANTPQDQEYIDSLRREIDDKQRRAAEDAAKATVPSLVVTESGNVEKYEDALDAKVNGGK